MAPHTLAAVILVGVMLLASGWPATAFASEWSSDSATTTEVEKGNADEHDAAESAEPTVESAIESSTTEVSATEEATEPPAPTPEPMPVVTLTATAECTADGGYTGFLTLVVSDAPATVTDVVALVTTGWTTPVGLAVALPATLAFDAASWQWWLQAPGGETTAITPTALLVRVAELAGNDAANQIAADGRNGWLLAELTQPVAACALPMPTSEATATSDGQGEGAEGAGEESAELATPEPTETPASDQAITAPETTPTTTDSPEANPTPDATENPEPTASSTDAAPAEATATPDASASAEPELIEIDVRSSDHDVEPGESTRYRFRVTNTTDHPVSLRLRTTDSAEGWTSTIYEADGTTELPARVKLDAGESINVIVLVVPPAEARPGDQNTTALDAVL